MSVKCAAVLAKRWQYCGFTNLDMMISTDANKCREIYAEMLTANLCTAPTSTAVSAGCDTAVRYTHEHQLRYDMERSAHNDTTTCTQRLGMHDCNLHRLTALDGSESSHLTRPLAKCQRVRGQNREHTTETSCCEVCAHINV